MALLVGTSLAWSTLFHSAANADPKARWWQGGEAHPGPLEMVNFAATKTTPSGVWGHHETEAVAIVRWTFRGSRHSSGHNTATGVGRPTSFTARLGSMEFCWPGVWWRPHLRGSRAGHLSPSAAATAQRRLRAYVQRPWFLTNGDDSRTVAISSAASCGRYGFCRNGTRCWRLSGKIAEPTPEVSITGIERK